MRIAGMALALVAALSSAIPGGEETLRLGGSAAGEAPVVPFNGVRGVLSPPGSGADGSEGIPGVASSEFPVTGGRPPADGGPQAKSSPRTAAEPPLTLAEAERGINGGLRVLAALADNDEAFALSERARATSGLKVFGDLGVSFNNEPASPGSVDSLRYNQLHGRTGLALPLIGGWARETLDKLDADARTAITRQELEAARTGALAALRKAWVSRWVEARKREVVAAYLESEEEVRTILQKRLDDRVILPYQRHNIMSTYDLARLEMERSLMLEERGRSVMRISLGRDVPLGSLAEPDLPAPLESGRLQEYLRLQHPEVRNLNEAAALLSQRSESARLVDYNFRLEGSYGVTRDFPGSFGDNWQLGLVFEMPLGVVQAGRSRQEAVQAAARRAKHNADIRREELAGYLSEAFRALEAGKRSRERSASQLDVSADNLQSARMRQGQFAFSAFEQILDARLVHFTVCLTALDSLGQYMDAVTDVLHFAPGADCAQTGLRRERITFPETAVRIMSLAAPETLVIDIPPDPPVSFREEAGAAAGADPAEAFPFLPLPPSEILSDHASSAGASPVLEDSAMEYSLLVPPGGRGESSPGQAPGALPLPDLPSPAGGKATFTIRLSALPADPAPSAGAFPAAASPAPGAARAGWRFGVYAWNAGPFLGEERSAELAALAERGIQRLLLSLNASELARAAEDRRPLRTLLDEAHALGMTVELLLGDPHWILPEHRHSLLAFILSMSAYPFDGLHLDLEQDQLPGAAARRDELARLTADTLTEVARACPWPVGFSIHHRYLDPEGATPWFAARLAGVAFGDVAVMAYITNPDTLIPLFARIAEASPGLRMTLSCSVESALPRESSHAGAGRAALFAAMRRVRDAVRAPNFAGVLIQSWEEYKEATWLPSPRERP